MTTATKSPTSRSKGSRTYAERLAAERDDLAKASRRALADAEQAYTMRQQALAEASERESDVSSALASGDDRITADDLMRAEAELRRAQALQDAAASALAKAQRGLINDDQRCADLFVPVLRDASGIGEVIAGTLPWPHADRQEPSVYVMQSEPATVTRTGTLTGTIEVEFLRSDLLRPLDEARVERAWLALGFEAEPVRSVATRRVSDGVELDSLSLRVHRAFDRAPMRAAEPPQSVVDSLAHDLRAALGEHMRWTGSRQRVALMGDTSTARQAPLSELVSASVAHSSVSDGIRTTVVDARITMSPSLEHVAKGTWPNVSAVVAREADAMVGKVTDAGRVSAVEVVSCTTPEDRTASRFKRPVYTAHVRLRVESVDL